MGLLCIPRVALDPSLTSVLWGQPSLLWLTSLWWWERWGRWLLLGALCIHHTLGSKRSLLGPQPAPGSPFPWTARSQQGSRAAGGMPQSTGGWSRWAGTLRRTLQPDFRIYLIYKFLYWSYAEMIMFWIYWILKCGRLGHSLVAQWLGLALSEWGGFAPWLGTKIPQAAEHAPPQKEIHFTMSFYFIFMKTFPPVLMRYNWHTM